MIDIPLYS